MNIELIRELTNWDYQDTPEDRLGIQRLGEGCFGHAYKLRDGTVLKVGRCVDGTALWIMHAAKVYRDTGKPAKYAPRVYAFEVLESGRWWARMEWVTSAEHKTGQLAWYCSAQAEMWDYLTEWGDYMALDTHEDEYAYPDAHGGNWGYTRHGRAVCFDPFAGAQEHSTENILPGARSLPKHRAVRHAGPTQGRWARG